MVTGAIIAAVFFMLGILATLKFMQYLDGKGLMLIYSPPEKDQDFQEPETISKLRTSQGFLSYKKLTTEE